MSELLDWRGKLKTEYKEEVLQNEEKTNIESSRELSKAHSSSRNGSFTAAELEAADFRRKYKSGGIHIGMHLAGKTNSNRTSEQLVDEFGRDIINQDSSSIRYERKYRSISPPPPDPIRHELDEERHGRYKERIFKRNVYNKRKSRSRSRSCSRSRSHKRRNRSRSRSKNRSKSRSNSSSIERKKKNKKRSKSRERKIRQRWYHDKFQTLSPSPEKKLDPDYKPPPESWVSRAGGVYIPK